VYPIQSSSGDFVSGTGFPSAAATAYRLISPPGRWAGAGMVHGYIAIFMKNIDNKFKSEET